MAPAAGPAGARSRRDGRGVAVAHRGLRLGAGRPSPASPAPRPAAAPRLYADPVNSLFAAAAQLAGRDPAEAAKLRAIARTPAGFWAAGQPGEMQMITQVTRAAARHHSVPVIVAYNLPNRDACGKFSAGR